MRKLEYSRTQIDLLQVKPASLNPYPGPFLDHGVRRRISWTARLRSLARPDHRVYFKAASAAKREADAYAASNCSKYFEFQYVWPELMARMENDALLRTMLVQSTALRRGIDLSAQLPIAQATEEAEAAATGAIGAAADGASNAQGAAGAAGAGDFVPVSYDPGLTCEIRLNMED